MSEGPDQPDPTGPHERGGRAQRRRRSRELHEEKNGGESVLLPGGKVDPGALRRLAEEMERSPASEEDDAPNRVVFRLSRDLKKRLDRYLTDRIPFMSRTQLQRLIAEGGVTVNGRAPKASTALRSGDVVEVFVPPPPPSEIVPERIPLDVLYEDGHIIVLNKQADIIVHPARSHLSGTMINALAWRFAHESSGGLSGVGKEFARPGVVHRLDRHTTGAIVFAKDDEAHWRLGRQFEQRTVDKRYLAVVHGLVEPEVDVIDLPIGPHPSREKGYREKYVVRHDALGKSAVTIYRVLARLGEAGGDGGGSQPAPLSLVEVELKTGRTHQIRVHFSHRGWPLVGDDMYGGRAITLAEVTGASDRSARGAEESVGDTDGGSVLIGRQALHAATLGFRHPITGEPMSFTAPLPRDMAGLVSILTRSGPSASPGQRARPPGATIDVDALLDGR